MNYKIVTQSLYGEQNVVYVNELDDGSNVCFERESSEYQQYLAWLAEGNEPLPADEPPAD